MCSQLEEIDTVKKNEVNIAKEKINDYTEKFKELVVNLRNELHLDLIVITKRKSCDDEKENPKKSKIE